MSRTLAMGVALACWLAGCASAPDGQVVKPAQVAPLVKLQITGNQAFGFKELEQVALGELFLFRKTRPTKASVDDAAYALRLFYLNRGFRLAQVDYEIGAEDSALSLKAQSPPLRASFMIEEGPLTFLHSVEFLGDPSVGQEELLSFFGAGAKRHPYVKSQVEAGLGRLRAYYLDLGYRDVQVALQETSFDAAEARAYVKVQVQEGVRYHLAEVEFGTGEAEAEGVSFKHQDLLGQPYTPRLGFSLRSRILDAYARQGYPRCEARWSSELDPESGDVKLHYAVTPGRQVRIGQVNLSGNRRTRGGVIRARLPLKSGDLYDASKVQDGLRELYSTGLFESVRIDLAEDDSLNVTLLESSSLELRVEPGWGAYEGPRLNVVLDESNFLGTARRASLSAHVSPLAAGSRFTFYEPRIFGGQTNASTSIFTEQREEPSFSFENVGFDVVLHRRIDRKWAASLGYEFRLNELKDVDVQVLSAEDLEEPDVGLLAASVVYDDRDDLLLPTRGSRSSMKLELADQALGSEIDFVRSHMNWSHVLELGPDDGLAFNARAVLTHTLGAQVSLPLHERVFLGGENSVRSFKEGDVGPRDASGQSLGGDASSYLSVEWRRRLSGNFGGALFFDAGNVEDRVRDFLRFDDYRFGVGVGLRYALPIGPLRLDVGFNPAAREQDDDYVVHFSVGFAY